MFASNRQVDFRYDRVYNRTLWTDTLGSVSVSYTDNAMNQYTSVGGMTPTYDSRGNITSGYGGGATLSYDAENRLRMAAIGSGGVSYTYDLLGRRLRASRPGVMTLYVWDGAHIIAEYNALTGSLAKKYIYGPGMDNPVAMIDVGPSWEDWFYYFTDALGNVRLLADESGGIVEGYTYDVYGTPHVMSVMGSGPGPDGNWLTEDVTTQNYSSFGNPYLFTGRRWDAETGLYYYRFRDYAPKLGRFCQTDPLGYIDTMNLYAYCANNPVNWIDPWGLKCNGGERGRLIGERIGHVIGAAIGSVGAYLLVGGGPWGAAAGGAGGALGYDVGGDIGGQLGENIGSGYQPPCPGYKDWEKIGIPPHYIPGGGL